MPTPNEARKLIDEAPFFILSDDFATPEGDREQDAADDDREQSPPARFPLIPRAGLSQLPPPTWRVQNYITDGGFAVLYGPSGCGKTFIALSLTMSIATGRSWNGCEVQHGRVVYVAGEGVAGLDQRATAWEIHGNGGETVTAIDFVPLAVNLLDQAQVTEFIQVIKTMPEPPTQIVLDTLARCIVGGDENSAKDMGNAIASIDRIRRETGAGVLVIHHTGKGNQDTERGSSALRGAADTMILVKNDDGRITVSCEKQKDAAPFESSEWKLEQIEQADSCVPVRLYLDQAFSAPRPRRLARLQQQVLDAIQESREGISLAALVKQIGAVKSSVHSAATVLIKEGYVLYDKDLQVYHNGRPNRTKSSESYGFGHDVHHQAVRPNASDDSLESDASYGRTERPGASNDRAYHSGLTQNEKTHRPKSTSDDLSQVEFEEGEA